MYSWLQLLTLPQHRQSSHHNLCHHQLHFNTVSRSEWSAEADRQVPDWEPDWSGELCRGERVPRQVELSILCLLPTTQSRCLIRSTTRQHDSLLSLFFFFHFDFHSTIFFVAVFFFLFFPTPIHPLFSNPFFTSTHHPPPHHSSKGGRSRWWQ